MKFPINITEEEVKYIANSNRMIPPFYIDLIDNTKYSSLIAHIHWYWPHFTIYPAKSFVEFDYWCAENTVGYWYRYTESKNLLRYYFEDESDQIAFKLTWE